MTIYYNKKEFTYISEIKISNKFSYINKDFLLNTIKYHKDNIIDEKVNFEVDIL